MKEHKQHDIELEASLLKAMALKFNFERYIDVLDTKRLIPITQTLLKDYKKYYDKYNNDVDWDVFYNDFNMVWHKRDLDAADLAYYRETVFPLIRDSRITNDLFVTLLERETADKISKINEDGFDPIEVQKALDELNNLKQQYTDSKKDEDVFKLSEVDVSLLDTSNGLSWFLPALQAGLQSHMRGQFIVVAADSDTGKSAFCISQAVHVFKNLHKNNDTRPILYFTSEDTQEDLACRFLSNLYKDKVVEGFEGIIQQYGKVSEHYSKNYNDSLFVGMQIEGHSDLYKIKNKVNKYNPSLIIIDMLDKLSNSDNIQDLTALYQYIRGLANDGYPILGTSQTGNTSYFDKETGTFKTRKWLTDKDLANSKSGKQGAAYCMIMIGKDQDMPNARYISTTKKKRGRHVRVTCEIEDKFSLYREII